jgi:hypothetical protein
VTLTPSPARRHHEQLSISASDTRSGARPLFRSAGQGATIRGAGSGEAERLGGNGHALDRRHRHHGHQGQRYHDDRLSPALGRR